MDGGAYDQRSQQPIISHSLYGICNRHLQQVWIHSEDGNLDAWRDVASSLHVTNPHDQERNHRIEVNKSWGPQLQQPQQVV